MKTIKRVHFVGIGGVGMSSLAQFLLKKKKIISGSDISRSTTINKMKKLGCLIHNTHKAENISNHDLVITSTAIGKDNPEIMAARKKKD